MHVSHLSLLDFRSYPQVDVSLQPGVTAFVGPNGQGKTNLVEAVDYVAHLRSHRVPTDQPLVRMGADIRIEGHHAVVRGVRRLQGAPVKGSDLRAGAALVVAALGAEGMSEVHDFHHCERGYEDFAGKLQGLGATVELIKETATALI